MGNLRMFLFLVWKRKCQGYYFIFCGFLSLKKWRRFRTVPWIFDLGLLQVSISGFHNITLAVIEWGLFMSKMVRKIVIFSEIPSASRSLNLVCAPPTEFSSLENDFNLFVCGSSYGEKH